MNRVHGYYIFPSYLDEFVVLSKYVYLCWVCEMGAYEHIHVHVDEILVWNWVPRVGFFP